jgi:biopolymer transport protein ExbB
MPSPAALSRTRLALLFLGCLAVLLLLGSSPVAPTAHAQQAEGEEGGEAPAGKAAPPPARTGGLAQMAVHVIASLRWFLPIFILISIALVALVVLLFLELRMGVAIPPGFVEDFTDVVNKRRFKEAYEMVKEDSSFLARVLMAGMSRLQYGIEDARDAAINAVENIRAGKDQFIVYLATIGTLGPLLGLVGTVWGMIETFMELGRSTGGINAQQIADKISHALAVTLVGIALSVPAIFFHAFFRNRLTRISHDVGDLSDDLLTQMYHNSKKPGGADVADTRATPATVKPK